MLLQEYDQLRAGSFVHTTNAYPDTHPIRITMLLLRKTQEACGGLGGENPGAFLKAKPLPKSAQTLPGIALRAVGKSGNHFPAASKIAGNPSIRNKKSAQRGSFGPDVHVDIRPKNFGQALQILEDKHFGTDIRRGHP